MLTCAKNALLAEDTEHFIKNKRLLVYLHTGVVYSIRCLPIHRYKNFTIIVGIRYDIKFIIALLNTTRLPTKQHNNSDHLRNTVGIQV